MHISKDKLCNIVIPFLLGIALDYSCWAGWGLAHGWHNRINEFSFTYLVGDHGPLPLFSGAIAYVVWNTRKDVSPWIFLCFPILFILSAWFMLEQEKDTQKFQPLLKNLFTLQIATAIEDFRHIQFPRQEIVSKPLIILHVTYMVWKTPMIAFFLGVYPFFVRRWTRSLRQIMVVAYYLVALFALCLIVDRQIIIFSLETRILALSLVLAALAAFLFDWWIGLKPLLFRVKSPKPIMVPATS